MHAALTNEDILSQIFDRLGEEIQDTDVPNPGETPSKVKRAHLFNASLVCKAFSTLALNLLWRTMDGIIPLFSLLDNFRGEGIDSVIVGFISKENLSRFTLYSSRIRHLHMDGDSLSEGTCMQLTRLLNGRLFPRLRTLVVRVHTSTTLSELSLALCPSLTEIVLQVRKGPDPGKRSVVDQFITLLVDLCQTRDHLRNGSNLELQQVDASPSSWANVTHVSTSFPISSGAFSSLCMIPTLEHLSTAISRRLSSSELIFPEGPMAKFPSLKSVEISAKPIHIQTFIKAVSSVNFARITVATEATRSVWWDKLTETVFHRWGSKLRGLTLTQLGGSYLIWPTSVLNPTAQSPNLVKIGIEGSFQGDLSHLPNMLPLSNQLRHLILTQYGQNWNSLTRVHNMFPHLQRLRIAISLHDPDHLICGSATHLATHPLSTLELQLEDLSGPVSDIHQVAIARLIDRLFPLAQLRAEDWTLAGTRLIEQIQDYLLMIREVRLDTLMRFMEKSSDEASRNELMKTLEKETGHRSFDFAINGF